MSRLLLSLPLFLVVATAQATPAPPSAPAEATEEDRADFEEAMKGFVATGAEVDAEINGYVREEIARRKRFILRSYKRLLNDVDAIEAKRRDEAIRHFETFLRKYPEHPTHSSDAMFRLAELYFEKSAIDYAESMEAWDRDIREFEAGRLKTEPEQPVQDFAKTVRLYQGLLERFPEYRFRDAAFYLLGYVYDSMGELKRARESFVQLVQDHPESDYAPESWLRIGEYWFDLFQWNEAIEAYRNALAYKDSRFYDKALYKLAWTHFQRYDYDSAIQTFKELIAFYDSDALSDEMKDLAGALRMEAVEYLARSLAEDDWDGDGLKDENAGVERAVSYLQEGLPYERDILSAYARSLYELHEKEKYADAARVFSMLIDREPLDAENPAILEKIIAIYDVMGDDEQARSQREQVVERFHPGSDWYRANREDGAATAKADMLVELMLRQQAQLHHQAAQQLRRRGLAANDVELLRLAGEQYRKAADAYARYINGYPHSKHTYDMTFFHAEALFFSGRFKEAAERYRQVREYPGLSKYREVAGFSAIDSLVREIETLVLTRKIPRKSFPGAEVEGVESGSSEESGKERDSAVNRVKGEKMPEMVLEWVKTIDGYVDADLNRPNDPGYRPKILYQAAEMFHRFKNYEESRTRFEELIDLFPKTQVAVFAAANIINSFREENDWASIEKWAALLQVKQIGEEADQARLAEEIRVFKLGAQFKRAQQLLEAGEHLSAAREFERIVNADSAQTLEFADKALFNAALAYEEVKYFDSAARVYERIATEERFKKSEFVEDAIFNLAENHKKFFSFDEAVQWYQVLVRRNPNHTQAYYSLFESARLLENGRKFEEAARSYERYVALYGSREDAPAVLFRAGGLYEKLGNPREMRRVLEEFIERYMLAPNVAELVVHARLKLARDADARKKKNRAAELYAKVISEFEAFGLQPGTPAAAWPAEAAFRLVEQKFAVFKAIQLKGNMRKVGKAIQRKEALLKELVNEYVAIFPYKAFDWTFAAYFRVGHVHQVFASSLYEAPIPSSFSEEEREIYQMELEDAGVVYEDTAVSAYEKTVLKARELKFRNEWTDKALTALNAYRPEEYPLLKEERRAITLTPWTRARLDAVPGEGIIRAPEVPTVGPEGTR